jgi:hypothetical protein
MFGRSVRAVQVAVPKFRVVVRNAPVRVRSLRTFDRSARRVPKSQAFDLNGLRLVLRIRGVQRVLVVHIDPAMRLARAAGIVTRPVRVRSNRRDNDPATRLARAAGIVTRPVRVRRRDNNRSRQRALGRLGRGAAERSPPRDKVTRASAIALTGEDDLAGSENASLQCMSPLQSGHPDALNQCPLLGVKRTCVVQTSTAGNFN